VEALAGDAARGGAAEEGGVEDAGLEDAAEHEAGAMVHAGDAGVVVEICVEELAEGAIGGAELGAVADEWAAVAADVIGGLDAACGDGAGAV